MIHGSRGRTAALGMTALLTAAGAAETAFGTTFKTEIKLTSVEPDGAKGKVNSPNPKCERGRKVSLFFVVQGGPDQKIGTDKTNRKGKFEIEESLFAGTYYAKVAKKTLGSGKRGLGAQAAGKKVCKAKKSKRKKG